MTSFILLQNVAYEGASLKGVFATFEEALDHIDKMDGYCMDEFTCNRDEIETLENYEFQNVMNASAGWHLEGPADLSFSIFACAV